MHVPETSPWRKVVKELGKITTVREREFLMTELKVMNITRFFYSWSETLTMGYSAPWRCTELYSTLPATNKVERVCHATEASSPVQRV